MTMRRYRYSPQNRSAFTAANGTALTALTPEIGSAWVAYAGVVEVQSNVARRLSGTNPLTAVESFASDVAVGATITLPASGAVGAGLVVRAGAAIADGYWLLHQDGTHWILYEFDGATLTQRATATGGAPSTSYRVVLAAIGSTITCYVDGVQVWTYASATRNQTNTRHGLRFATSDNLTAFDDFAAWRSNHVRIPTGVV